jgi:nickel/cobalt transporter (NicO) family protein
VMRRALVVGVAVGAVLVVAGPAASAHPLGNFTTNTYAGLRVAARRTLVDYVVDLAEVPTLAARSDVDTDGDDRIDDGEAHQWRARQCLDVAGGSRLEVGGRRAAMTVRTSSLRFPPGEAGLDTLRLECELVAERGAADGDELIFRTTSFADRVGWHEVTAVGDGTTVVASDVPADSVSERLTRYPTRSPLDQRSARLEVRPGGAPLAPRPSADDGGAVRGGDRFTAAFTTLVAERELTVAFALVALALAVGLGALHAVAPGHGKTLMAAYVLGREGTFRQLAAIGATVAATHTAGVLVLGVAVSAWAAFAPERALTWASVASGLLLAGVGVGLLQRRRAGHGHSPVHGGGHRHGHGHGPPHGHGHGPVDLRAGHRPAQGAAGRPRTAPSTGGVGLLERPVVPRPHPEVEPDPAPAPVEPDRPWRSVVGMGFAGGLVPSPSALVVLLGAIALGRTWFGVVLVIGYGVGMAATLVAAGLLLLRASARLHRWAAGGGRLTVVTRVLPFLTAVALILGGLSISLRAVL